tara:strand:+ start:55 stop:6252 length:6198 start_codon:yes stop_codon:yes gene_type:complete
MGLSRLDNFLKSSRGTILYVNPNDLDSTDSIENQGNSLTRPFRTIQRALVEAARFSYQKGLNNDRFGRTTILIYPGEHVVDNRPGFIPDGTNTFRLRNGGISNDLPDFNLTSNFDVNSATNELYKLNSVYGGVIVPRGTSIVGLDLRKTKIRPKYIPDPLNDNIERSAIFRITGAGYFWQFSIFDGNPNASAYKDYTTNTFVPNFSHHKLTCFEYADGVNNVVIEDAFQTFVSDRTDLDMYYEKVSLVYGEQSGRTITPEYPDAIEIEKKIDEYRIVGSIGESVGISSIKAGDGVLPTSTITVTTSEPLDNLEVDTPFRIQGITAAGYDGQYVIFDKTSDTEVIFKGNTVPTNALPNVSGATLTLSSDTVTSASPYIFNVSLRSVFGMNGMHADGSKATGFRSMVVAQFTGIGLQKDDNAFVIFNNNTPSTGNYDDSTSAGNATISNNSRARYKPNWRNVHIKCSNKSIIQVVSCFAIGFAEQFVAESGGDISLTNSNSNFGAVALSSDGYRTEAFTQDDQGYITHVLPPEELPVEESSIEFTSIDVLKTLPPTHSLVGVGTTSHLFLYNETNQDVLPENIVEGYRIGAKTNDELNFVASVNDVLTKYSAKITMPGPVGAAKTDSGEKIFKVSRSVTGINLIGTFSDGGINNVITLRENHNFFNGESVRIISSTGQLPDGLFPDKVYYVITESTDIPNNKPFNIKLAQSLTDAINDIEIAINSKGGELQVVSRVSDKVPGEFGHPIQYDTFNSQWYVNVSAAATENTLFPAIVGLGSTSLGNATPRTFIDRKRDERSGFDKLYHIRYVIPKNSSSTSRPPVEGFIIQDSNGSLVQQSELNTYFGTGDLSNSNDHRNLRFINNAQWDVTSRRATFSTELPHKLRLGNKVTVSKVRSSNNLNATNNLGYNRSFNVVGISSSKSFTVDLSSNPGTFQNNINLRDTTLPLFSRSDYDRGIYYCYRVAERQKYLRSEQDGIYYLTMVDASIKPTVAPFSEEKYSQPVKSLFPQLRRDDPISDPEPAQSHVRSSLIGQVDISDKRHSITRKAFNEFSNDSNIGISISNLVSGTAGIAHTITTDIDHGLNGIVKVSIVDPGGNYGTGALGDEVFYNARLVNSGIASITGSNATAKVVVGTAGTIKELLIMDGGSAYGIGNTITVTGISTIIGHVPAIFEVTNIMDSTGETIKVSGIASDSLQKYNDLYRITGIATGQTNQIQVASAATITDPVVLPAGIDSINSQLLEDAQLQFTGSVVNIISYEYDHLSGISTVRTGVNNPHGYSVGQRIRLDGANESIYNGFFVVTEILDDLTIPDYGFKIKVGVGTESPTQTGTMRAYDTGYAPNQGVITFDNENFGGRQVSNYAGITTTISVEINTLTNPAIRIAGASKYDIRIGDYFQIDDEIVRVRGTTAQSSFSGANNVDALQDDDNILVFRGILGTRAAKHPLHSTIRRINVLPVEFRRHSIIRASGHTFEYVGYGPGNYSTAFPDKQDREITPEEELISQSTKRGAGINFYTGMNDKGISYSGNKRLSTITGREEIFDTPVETVEGEDILSLSSINVLTGVEGNFSRSIKVDGGANKEAISEFNGPVIVSNKLTVRSDKGVESNNLFLQGNTLVSRKYTVGLGTPSLSGNPGDLVFNANPVDGGNAGWIYTLSNQWRSFGTVSLTTNTKEDLFEKVGIGTTTAGDKRLQVLGGTDQFSVDSIGHVGIGTSANGFALNVTGGPVFFDNDFVIGAGITISGQLTVNDGPVNIGGTISNITGVGIHSVTSGPQAGTGVSIFSQDTTKTVYYYGDGQGLVNLNADQVGWIRQGTNLSYEDVLNGRVGIGTSIPDGGTATDFLLGYSLTVGSALPGISGTSIYIHDDAYIDGSLIVNTNNLVSGVSTLSGPYRITNTDGFIVGTGLTFTNTDVTGLATCNNVFISGITTSDSHTFLRSFSETNNGITQSGGTLTLDLSTGQNFEVTLSDHITQINLTNPPTTASAMSFTIKFTQPSSLPVYNIDIDDIRIAPFDGSPAAVVSVKWPGGVVPVMSQAVNAIDIYSFKSFDVSNLNTSGLYGIIGGQNFV